jgi:hypothetical protein
MALAAALALALAGCTPGESAAPTPTAPVAPATETPTPTPPPIADAEVAAILVRADAVEYLDASGEPIEGIRDRYAGPVDPVLARLTELLGEPATETYESQLTDGTGTFSRWDGLAIEQFPAGMVADVPDAPTWGIRLEAASAGVLELVTVDGLSVGDPVPDGLEVSACNSPMAEVVGTVGVEIDGDPSVVSVRAPVYTDVCE